MSHVTPLAKINQRLTIAHTLMVVLVLAYFAIALPVWAHHAKSLAIATIIYSLVFSLLANIRSGLKAAQKVLTPKDMEK